MTLVFFNILHSRGGRYVTKQREDQIFEIAKSTTNKIKHKLVRKWVVGGADSYFRMSGHSRLLWNGDSLAETWVVRRGHSWKI